MYIDILNLSCSAIFLNLHESDSGNWTLSREKSIFSLSLVQVNSQIVHPCGMGGPLSCPGCGALCTSTLWELEPSRAALYFPLICGWILYTRSNQLDACYRLCYLTDQSAQSKTTRRDIFAGSGTLYSHKAEVIVSGLFSGAEGDGRAECVVWYSPPCGHKGVIKLRLMSVCGEVHTDSTPGGRTARISSTPRPGGGPTPLSERLVSIPNRWCPT